VQSGRQRNQAGVRQKAERGHRCIHVQPSGKTGGDYYGEECVGRNAHGIEYLKPAKERTPLQPGETALSAELSLKM